MAGSSISNSRRLSNGIAARHVLKSPNSAILPRITTRPRIDQGLLNPLSMIEIEPGERRRQTPGSQPSQRLQPGTPFV